MLLTLLVTLTTATTLLTADDAVRAALAHDPTLAQREADVDAAAGSLRQESRPFRSNPVLDVSGTVDGSQLFASVTQVFSLTGEGRRARRAAGAVLESVRAAGERARFETAAATRRAYARAVLAREQLRFAELDRALLARLREVTEAKKAAGDAIDLDLRLARLEEARTTAAWLDAQEAVAAADAELGALIGTSPDELAHDPLAAFPLESTEAAPRSDLLAARAATRAAGAAVDREQAAVLTPLGVGLYVQHDPGFTSVGLALSFELPLWNRNQAAIGAARGELRVARAVEAATAARASLEQARAAKRLLVASEALASLAPDLDADAAPALQAIETLYRSGAANLADTLVLRSRVVEGERAWVQTRAAVVIARIDVALARQASELIP